MDIGQEELPMNDRTQNRRSAWLALGFFLVLSVAANLPIALDLSNNFAAPRGDFAVGFWNQWWVASSFADGSNPFFCDLLLYPDGVSLHWRDMPILGNAIGTPIAWLFGTAVAYNVVYLLTFVFAGLGAYLLARYVTGSHLAGLAGGVAYSFVPGHFISYSQQSSSHVQWLPFLILSLLKLRDQGRFRYGFWAGIWLACMFHSNIYYGFYSALASFALWAFYMLWAGELRATRKVWTLGLVLCWLTTFAFFAPRGIPMLLELQGEGLQATAPGTRADLLGVALLLSPTEQPVLVGWMSFFGYTVATGAILATFGSMRRTTMIWWFLFAFFFLIGLGTNLRIGGHEFLGSPMPVDILRRIPFLGTLRAYHRANLISVLALAMLFACFVKALAGRSDKRPIGRRVAAALGVTGIAIVELWPTAWQAYPMEAPDFYAKLKQDRDDRSVLALPLDSYPVMNRAMLLQTVHGKPLVGCFCGRPNPNHRARLMEVEFFSRLLKLNHPEEHGEQSMVLDQEKIKNMQRELRERQVGAVVLDGRYLLPVTSEGFNRLEGIQGRGYFRPKLAKSTYFSPIWWGPLRNRLLRPAVGPQLAEDSDAEQEPGSSLPIVTFLESVLGAHDQSLPDGSRVWFVSQDED
ncbi:MAG: hypothetical protein DWQ01_10205 [Planctomycetota bacterium]|nr:MAG: hypothetical protein DWQ01_10205 [Planctomycetota bacterium]